MHANLISLCRRTTLLVGATLVLPFSPAFAASSANSDELPRFDSYIKVSGYAPSVSGNEASFQKRTQRDADGGIGIEDLRIVTDVNKETSLEIEGRAMFGSEDYLGDFKLTREGLGSFSTGYKRFRTFYDGIGGFFPLNGYWAPLTPEALAVDRGHFWAEGKLALKEDAPVFTLRYTNDTRSGQKDSTIWGDTNLTGLPTVPSNNATRKINPARLDLDERREIIEGRMDYAVGQTKYNLSFLSDQVKNLDTLNLVRYKGEVTPNPERVVQQRNGLESDSWLASFNSDTTLNPKMNLVFGLSYRELESTLSGERPNAVGVVGSYDFKDLAGGSDMEVWTANAALVWRPSPVWQIIPALRWEDNYTKSAATFTRVAQSSATTPPTFTYYGLHSRVKEQILTPDLSFRYTGIRKLVLYGTFSDRITDGDDRRVNPFTTPAPATSDGYDELNLNQAHYKLGANLNSSGALILRGEVFVKDHENKFIGYANQLGNRYVVGYQFTGLKLTAIFKPVPELSFSTRYQPQWGKMQVTTESTPEFDSMDAESHLISETINWNPSPLIYVQAAVNVAYNVISSAYPSSANPNQRNSDNNYWTGSVLTGFVLARDTNAQIEFTYQEADNFEPALAAFSQPYGASYRDYTVAVGVKHKFSDRWIGSAKVGYIESRNDTTGGHTNFKGPLAYVGLEYGL